MLMHGVFFEHEEAYFRQSWNILDFLILVFQVTDVPRSPFGTLLYPEPPSTQHGRVRG